MVYDSYINAIDDNLIYLFNLVRLLITNVAVEKGPGKGSVNTKVL